MPQRRSDLQQPVALLFTASRAERDRRAVPVLRALRALVADVKPLLEALPTLPIWISEFRA